MFDVTNIINKYSLLLEAEESNTINSQLESFLSDYLLYNKENIPTEMYEDFQVVMNIINDETLDLDKRFIDIVKSDFFYNILTFKNNSREKELRRLTLELSDFIKGLGHKKMTISNPQSLIADRIRLVADDIEPRKYKNPKVSMNDAWCNCLVEEAMRRFK